MKYYICALGIQAYEPFEVKNDDIFGKVKDYMKSDCYMYAPLVTHQPWLRSPIHAVSPATGNFGSDVIKMVCYLVFVNLIMYY